MITTRMIKRAFALCLIGCLASISHAQQEGGVKMNIITYAPVELPEDFKAFYKTGSDIYPFHASSSSIGIPVLYKGPRDFILRASEEDFSPPKEGEKPKPPLAFVELPVGADNVLVMAVPNQSTKGIRLVAYDISTRSLRSGDYMAFNFATTAVAVRFGEKKFTIQPGKELHVKNQKWREEVLALPLQIAIQIEGETKIVYSRYWEHYPQKRNLMFFFNGHHPSKPIVFSCFNAYERQMESTE